MYFRKIQNFLEYIPRERVFFFILEEYLSNRRAVAKRLIEFLELPFINLPEGAHKLHMNKGKIPKHINIKILKKRIFRCFGNTHYMGKLPYSIPQNMKTHKLVETLIKLHKRINPAVNANIPAIKTSSKVYLDHLFKSELISLNELIGMNVIDLWFDTD